MKRINIAVIGLGFGSSFAQIFAHHPNVDKVYVVDNTKERITEFFEKCEKDNVYVHESFEDVLRDDTIDAVHVCTGIPAHSDMSAAVLKAGKHCACAVPMADTIDGIKKVVDAARESGKNYMMMETVLFGAEFLTAKEMKENGEFGKIQHMRGLHYQPMDSGYWAEESTKYWRGLPPMHYSTHAIAPLRAIADSRIEKVVCFGTGTMSERLTKVYGNPYPIEDALLSFESGLKAQVVRGLFECSAYPAEAFNIYGSQKTIMTEYCEKIIEKVHDESFYDHTAFVVENRKWKNFYNLLPKELHPFTIELPDNKKANYEEYLDTAPLAGHSGSHPHLCNEFVMSIIEGRKSYVDEEIASNTTAAGICAHMSAMKDGEIIRVPKF